MPRYYDCARMINASLEGILYLPSHGLELPIRRSYYAWQQRTDHRGRPASKVRFGSFHVEVTATQSQLSSLTELAANPHAVVDGHAAFSRADGQGTFVTVWFSQACLHRFAEQFISTGTRGQEPSWAVQFALSPEQMGRESGSGGEFVAPVVKAYEQASRAIGSASNQLGSATAGTADSGSAYPSNGSFDLAALKQMAKEVNPLRGLTNCTHITEAVVARLRGTDPAATAPNEPTRNLIELEELHNVTVEFGKDFYEVFDIIRNSPEGTIGIVVFFPKVEGMGHVITITNQRGLPHIIEGQYKSPYEPCEVITSPSRAVTRYGDTDRIDVGLAILPPTHPNV